MTTHPSPFHRQRQSNKTLDPTGQTAKFLYTILKQLDLKNIDWNEVADSLDITNGHAARMRWSRFRAQIEGLDNSYSRKSTRRKDGEKKRKKDKQYEEELKMQGEDTDRGTKRAKFDSDTKTKDERYTDIADGVFGNWPNAVKDESIERTTTIDGVTIHHPTITTVSMPQAPSVTSGRYYPDLRDHMFSQKSGNAPSLVAPSPQTKQSSMRPSTPAKNQWQQPYSYPGYTYPPYHPTNLATPHYPSSTMYSHTYSSLSPRIGHHPTSQIYDQPVKLNQVQMQPSMYNRNHANPTASVPATMSAMRNYPQQAKNLSHAHTYQHATPSTGRLGCSNQSSSSMVSTTTIPANPYELAYEASYPWPYSETSIAEFIQAHGNKSNTIMVNNGKDKEIPVDPQCSTKFAGAMSALDSSGLGEAQKRAASMNRNNDGDQTSIPVASLGTRVAIGGEQQTMEGAQNIAEYSVDSDQNEPIIKSEPDLQDL